MLRFFSKTLATLVFGFFALLASAPVALVLAEARPANPVFFGVIILVAVVCFTASTGRTAWARGSILVGILFIALPLAVAIIAGLAVNEVALDVQSSQFKQRVFGTAATGAFATTIAVFVGIVLGAIFILLGLLLGRGGSGGSAETER